MCTRGFLSSEEAIGLGGHPHSAGQAEGNRWYVIEGVFRDLLRIMEARYPIFSRGRFMMTGKDGLWWRPRR